MSESSPARRSQVLSSPQRSSLSSFLADTRNSESNHLDALAAAANEHERVRLAALRVFELHELEQKHRRIVEDERKEEQRLQAEARIVAEELRLRELRAKTVPKPPPEPKPEPKPEPPKQPPTPKAEPATQVNGATPTKQAQQPGLSTTPASEIKKPAAATTPSPFAPKPSSNGNPFANPASTQTAPQNTLFPAKTQPPAAPAKAPVAAPSTPTPDRYSQIHQELKKLRKDLQAQSKVPGSPLKGKMGTFRREIRVSIGQLTAGKGANAQPIKKISSTLKEALSSSCPSPPIDVSLFVRDKREPVEGAVHNEQVMPALFIYLMNICAKGIINQFINEASANTKAADPIGVFTAHIFSDKDFQWRGVSLIDILMAKFRIVCPVLFGFRGNDRTERGRLALGWKKDGPSWITEQSHNDRMTGLGAGFASLSLRDFSKSTKSNPYPPTNYWIALAGIVNSPPNETSNTQYIVLRSMIQGHEQRFLNFYGTAALAALRLALIDFPNKAPATATAAGSLKALAEVLRVEGGLVLT